MINLNLYITEKFKISKNHTYQKDPEYDDIIVIIICSTKNNTCDVTTGKIERITDYQEDKNDKKRLLITIKYDLPYQDNIYPKKFITDTEDSSYDARQYKDGSRIFTSKQFFLLYKDTALNLLEDFIKRNKNNKDKKLYKDYSVIWGDTSIEIAEDIIDFIKKGS